MATAPPHATYQSPPNSSPPAGVQAAQKVYGLTVGATVRTLPSARATSIPAACGVRGTRGSHGDRPCPTWNGTGAGGADVRPTRTGSGSSVGLVGSGVTGATMPVEARPAGSS